jgi:hypothetical protein
LRPSMRAKAIAKGAVAVSSVELVRRCRRPMLGGNGTPPAAPPPDAARGSGAAGRRILDNRRYNSLIMLPLVTSPAGFAGLAAASLIIFVVGLLLFRGKRNV